MRRSCAGFMCALMRHTATDSSAAHADPPDGVADGVLVERRDDRAVVGDPFRDLQAMASRDQRRRRVPEDVVELLAVRAADLEDVAEALGGDKPGRSAALGDDRVRGDGRPVEEAPDVTRRDAELRTPSITARSKSGGVDGTFATRNSPASLSATRSVNVPPVSQPTIHDIAPSSPWSIDQPRAQGCPRHPLHGYIGEETSPGTLPGMSDLGDAAFEHARTPTALVQGGIVGRNAALRALTLAAGPLDEHIAAAAAPGAVVPMAVRVGELALELHAVALLRRGRGRGARRHRAPAPAGDGPAVHRHPRQLVGAHLRQGPRWAVRPGQRALRPALPPPARAHHRAHRPRDLPGRGRGRLCGQRSHGAHVGPAARGRGAADGRHRREVAVDQVPVARRARTPVRGRRDLDRHHRPHPRRGRRARGARRRPSGPTGPRASSCHG